MALLACRSNTIPNMPLSWGSCFPEFLSPFFKFMFAQRCFISRCPLYTLTWKFSLNNSLNILIRQILNSLWRLRWLWTTSILDTTIRRWVSSLLRWWAIVVSIIKLSASILLILIPYTVILVVLIVIITCVINFLSTLGTPHC